MVLHRNNPRKEKDAHKVEASLRDTKKSILKNFNSNIIDYGFVAQTPLRFYTDIIRSGS